MTKKLPEPLYCCENSACCEETTWPAEDLWWSDVEQGWFCVYCWDDLEPETPGISLEQELKDRGLSR